VHKAQLLDGLPVVAYVSLAPRTLVQLNRRYHTLTVMVAVEGRQMGLKDRLFGEIGTMRIPLTPLSKMGPPADRE